MILNSYVSEFNTYEGMNRERDSHWENGYIESFNGKLQDYLLNREIFTTLTEAKIERSSRAEGLPEPSYYQAGGQHSDAHDANIVS